MLRMYPNPTIDEEGLSARREGLTSSTSGGKFKA